MKKQKLLLVLGAVSCVALTSCGQKEITASEAKEIAKSSSEFKTNDYSFIKATTTITKYDVTSGSASIYKEFLVKYAGLEVGKASTETYQYSTNFSNYIINKEYIESIEKTGATNVKYYADGKKLSVTCDFNDEEKFNILDKEYTFKVATKLTQNFNEDGYLSNSVSNIDITFTDNSTCSEVSEMSIEWVK